MPHDTSGNVQRPTIAVSTTPAYVSGNVVGGLLTLPGVMMAPQGVALLRSVTLKDAAGVGPALSLLFFRATPSGGYYRDNAPLVLGASDVANLIAVVRVLSTDWYTPSGSGASFVCAGGIDQVMKSATADLFVVIVADGAYTALATTNLSVEIGFEQR